MADPAAAWSELVKLLHRSRAIAAAVFLGTGAMLYGPELAPNLFTPHYFIDWRSTPQLRLWVLAPFCISGAFLVVALLQAIFGWSGWRALRQSTKGKPRSQHELVILYLLGMGGSNPRHLDEMSRVLQISLLQLEHAADQLASKGLIDRNSFDPNLISLSDRGRGVALNEVPRRLRLALADDDNQAEPRQ